MQFPSCLNLRPAKNLEELEKLINSGDLVERLAGAEKPSLQSTVRGMMKLLLTRELALRFSFTGMDSRRQTTKESFKSHAAYEMIIAALKLTKHFLVKRADVNRAVMNALKNVPDWEGFRDHRIRKPTATPKSSAASTSIDIKNDVEASGYSDDLIAETLKTIRTFTQERNMSQSPPASDVIGDAIRALNA
ncbi:uncharacterized protein LOC108675914 [Hyalella azteca]|uniref:Uncharacterized protein LOC108675914 n=1 Tax=Hyalella azteca TaxID=294128 RepID=A0A8B7P0C5_HYAAZ|nr:uncharacterized protein LOC108675914 [Hyalella azteca]